MEANQNKPEKINVPAIAVNPEDLGFLRSKEFAETIANMNGEIMRASYQATLEKRTVDFLEQEVSDRFLRSREYGEVAALMRQEGERIGAARALVRSQAIGILGGVLTLLLQCPQGIVFGGWVFGSVIGIFTAQPYVQKQKEDRLPPAD